MIYLSSVVIIGSYFKRYRNLAFAIATSAAGLGALIIPRVVNYCTELYGWRGCMLIMSGVFLQALIVAAVMRPQNIPDRLLELEADEDPEMSRASLKNKPIDLMMTTSIFSLVSITSIESVQRSHRVTENPRDDDGTAECGEQDAFIQSQRELNDRATLGKGRIIGNDQPIDVGSNPKERTMSSLTAPVQRLPVHIAREMKSRCFVLSNNKRLILLMLNYFFTSAGTIIGYVHFPAYFISKGASTGDISLMMTLFGVSNSVGRLLSGALTSGTDDSVLLVYTASGGLASVTLFLCPFLSNYKAGRLLFSVLFSLYANTKTALMIPMTLEICNLDNFSIIYGVELFVGGVSVLLSPPFAGWLYDISGDYVVPFLLAGSMYMIGTFLLMLLPLINGLEDVR
ncbi:hypothetical protein LSH36_616g03030 [Paralvinella palmiformis]|uniref:Monocarboxylate transporter n=1 Tax=Paralvinella palmiformis TaxID=53620 RepID=A0AAD9MUV6_9ANNE|nr:hypothetical protein LSH36_616g03030 [Paralvinella palmiformis]